jgi:hypothetical protein
MIGIVAKTTIAGRTGITATGVPIGSSHRGIRSIELQEKPPDSSGFSVIAFPADGLGITRRLAGHRGIALLNDALLRRLFPAGSGRIAQLVEQMTLNHRVPGSSPGAPTKHFKQFRPTRELAAIYGILLVSSFSTAASAG